MTLMEAYKQPGISDLPMKVRLLFGKAWMAEYEGRPEDAAALLDEAVEAEAAGKSAAKK
jgi:hypothetical protein